jgi:hypothetical protein
VERCPLCRAALNGADTCRRCRAELQMAQRVEREGSVLVDAAIHHLALGHADRAERLLRRALVLHAAPQTRALWRLAVSALAAVGRDTGPVLSGRQPILHQPP